MQEAVESVPECPSRESLRRLVRSESERLVPQTACDQLLREAGLARASSLAVAAGLAPAAGASAQTVRGVTG